MATLFTSNGNSMIFSSTASGSGQKRKVSYNLDNINQQQSDLLTTQLQEESVFLR
jgi:hypothetical protein